MDKEFRRLYFYSLFGLCGIFFSGMVFSGSALVRYYGAESLPGGAVILLIGLTIALLIPFTMKFKFTWDRAVARGKL